MKSKTISQITALAAVLMLTIMLFMPFQTVASAIALAGCPETCGDIEIPYPFGIGPKCSLPGFELSCNVSNNGSPTPFLFNNIPVLQISLIWGHVLVNKSIMSSCYNQATSSFSNTSNDWNLSGTPYRINSWQNKFTVFGCDIDARMSIGNETDMFTYTCMTSGCFSQDRFNIDRVCSGEGCCQIDIPEELSSYEISLQYRNYSSAKQYNSSQCGYVVLGADIVSEFRSTDITISKLYKHRLYLDWSIGNESCKMAQERQDKSSYACISDHSMCINSNNSPGYSCYCSDHYEGNPYIKGGCLLGVRNFCPAFARPNTTGDCQLYVPYVIGNR
ncbi:hypothetical protein LUZ61_016113 [Rhynchospora tenuis]|uniref:Wall-associated receptor kinase galacturonan-binding domain-containing protein n=1 Tax=Rhynchospora tenuis TaxID=198213 RepID=A0AAD5Z4X0_9POAL|nr:hypothetical protein LUZ61_016113 [Rhynchospora tenuis]